MSTILIVEDDTDINDMLTKLLVRNGYKVKNAYSGTEGVLVHDKDVNLILLDLMLPGKSGEQVIGELKEKNNVPVIVTSAISDIDKKLDLFKLGANDYVTKPFNNDELLARIKVWLREKKQTDKADRNGYGEKIVFKDIELNMANYQVKCNGTELKLTKKEYELIKLFLEHQNQTMTKSMIFEQVWDYDTGADENTLNVHISKIKNKLKECNPQEEYIETVWSVGYRLKK
ncbi:MAG: response regulator transcription factor [Lachnospiraceae bacterium]|nr:response regulator transcription factor [Lachnospiraceae bacterium]